MSTPQPAALDPQCEAILQQHGFYADDEQNGTTMIRDEEGTAMFRVPITIDAFSLVSMIDYGARQYENGRKWGRTQLQHELRGLLGAAGIPDPTP